VKAAPISETDAEHGPCASWARLRQSYGFSLAGNLQQASALQAGGLTGVLLPLSMSRTVIAECCRCLPRELCRTCYSLLNVNKFILCWQ
jgi:hypothetical protein